MLKDSSYAVEKNEFLFVGGDFDVAQEGSLDIDQHFPLAAPISRNNVGSLAKAINELFSFLAEVAIDEHTHYTKSIGMLSFIDRAAYSSSWISSFLDISASFLLGLPLCA